MKDLLEKASHIRLLMIDVDSVLTDGGLELLSRVRGAVDSSNDGNCLACISHLRPSTERSVTVYISTAAAGGW